MAQRNEAMFALAHCVRRGTGENQDKLRSEVYKQFQDLIKTDEDFLQFISFYELLNENNGKGFGRGMRKCIANWYDSKSPAELVKIFTNHRRQNGWDHGDILKMAHVNFGADLERQSILKAMLVRPHKFVYNNREQTATMTDNQQFLYKVFRLRICEDVTEAKKIIAEDTRIVLAHVPTHFYNDPMVWQLLLARFTFREILRLFSTWHVLQLIGPETMLAKKVGTALCNQNLIESSKVHPLEVLALKRAYEKNEKFSWAVVVNIEIFLSDL